MKWLNFNSISELVYFFVDSILNEESVGGDVIYNFVSVSIDVEVVDVLF